MDYATPQTDALKNEGLDPTDTPVEPNKNLKEIAASKAKQAAQEVQAKAEQIKSVASEKAGQFKSYAELKAEELKSEASVKAQAVKKAASEQYDRGVTKVRDAHADTEDYIRKNPSKSVLVAFGAGLLVGLLARRR